MCRTCSLMDTSRSFDSYSAHDLTQSFVHRFFHRLLFFLPLCHLHIPTLMRTFVCFAAFMAHRGQIYTRRVITPDACPHCESTYPTCETVGKYLHFLICHKATKSNFYLLLRMARLQNGAPQHSLLRRYRMEHLNIHS